VLAIDYHLEKTFGQDLDLADNEPDSHSPSSTAESIFMQLKLLIAFGWSWMLALLLMLRRWQWLVELEACLLTAVGILSEVGFLYFLHTPPLGVLPILRLGG